MAVSLFGFWGSARASRAGFSAPAEPTLTDVSDEGVADRTRGRVRSPNWETADRIGDLRRGTGLDKITGFTK
jgi:hypothetical protein